MFLKGEVVIRKLSVSLLTLVAIVSALNLVCQAQSQPFLSRHVREAVLNGEAKLVGPPRNPISALRHRAGHCAISRHWRTFCKKFMILPAPSTATS